MLASAIVLVLAAEPAPAPEPEWPPIQRPSSMQPRPSTPPAEAPSPEAPDDATGPAETPRSPAPPDDPGTPPPGEPDVVPPAPDDGSETEEPPAWTQVDPSPAPEEPPEWTRVHPSAPPPPLPSARGEADAPFARPSSRADRPQQSGRGMLIAAAALGTTGLIVKGIGTSMAVTSERSGRPFNDPMFAYVASAGLYDPILGGSLALLGGGMAARGKLLAYEDVYEGRSLPVDPVPGIGWGLFGAGVGAWAITRILGLTACGADLCRITVWEAGYYGSLALTVPGIAMAARATTYQRYRREHDRPSRLSLTPLRARGAWGLGLVGRF